MTTFPSAELFALLPMQEPARSEFINAETKRLSQSADGLTDLSDAVRRCWPKLKTMVRDKELEIRRSDGRVLDVGFTHAVVDLAVSENRHRSGNSLVGFGGGRCRSNVAALEAIASFASTGKS